MAIVELNSQKVDSNARGAIEEFKIVIDSFKDRMDVCELESSNSRRTASVMTANFDIFQENSDSFRYQVNNDFSELK